MSGLQQNQKIKLNLKKGTGKVNEVNSKSSVRHTSWKSRHRSYQMGNSWKSHRCLMPHPHPSNSGKIAIVHNGIIENFEELKKQLET